VGQSSVIAVHHHVILDVVGIVRVKVFDMLLVVDGMARVLVRRPLTARKWHGVGHHHQGHAHLFLCICVHMHI